MADTLTTDVTATFDWLFTESLDLSTPTDQNQLKYDKTFADGTSDNQADKIWHDQRTIAGPQGTDDDLDLTALTNTVFGSTVTINFAKVKGILIVNTDTTDGDDLYLDSSVANAFTPPFNGSATSKIEIPADSILMLVNRVSGWTVTAGTGDILRITNDSANSIIYNITIFGTSA